MEPDNATNSSPLAPPSWGQRLSKYFFGRGLANWDASGPIGAGYRAQQDSDSESSTSMAHHETKHACDAAPEQPSFNSDFMTTSRAFEHERATTPPPTQPVHIPHTPHAPKKGKKRLASHDIVQHTPTKRGKLRRQELEDIEHEESQESASSVDSWLDTHTSSDIPHTTDEEGGSDITHVVLDQDTEAMDVDERSDGDASALVPQQLDRMDLDEASSINALDMDTSICGIPVSSGLMKEIRRQKQRLNATGECVEQRLYQISLRRARQHDAPNSTSATQNGTNDQEEFDDIYTCKSCKRTSETKHDRKICVFYRNNPYLPEFWAISALALDD